MKKELEREINDTYVGEHNLQGLIKEVRRPSIRDQNFGWIGKR